MSKKTSSSSESAARLVVPPVSMVTSGGRAVGGADASLRPGADVDDDEVGVERRATLRERMPADESSAVDAVPVIANSPRFTSPSADFQNLSRLLYFVYQSVRLLTLDGTLLCVHSFYTNESIQ